MRSGVSIARHRPHAGTMEPLPSPLVRIMSSRVTLPPGRNGTKKLLRQYGDRLLRVRYRYDSETRRRLTTVELIVDEVPWEPAAPAKPRGQV
jgi:hypothetical protein